MEWVWLNSRVLASEVRIRPQTLIGSGLFIYSDLAGTSFISFMWPLAMWRTVFLCILNWLILRLCHSGIFIHSGFIDIDYDFCASCPLPPTPSASHLLKHLARVWPFIEISSVCTVQSEFWYPRDKWGLLDQNRYAAVLGKYIPARVVAGQP